MAKKKAAKQAAKKKPARKKAAGGRTKYKANLKSIRAAIDKVIAHLEGGHAHASKKAALNEPAMSRATRILESLKSARATVASECCDADQNCPFDVI